MHEVVSTTRPITTMIAHGHIDTVAPRIVYAQVRKGILSTLRADTLLETIIGLEVNFILFNFLIGFRDQLHPPGTQFGAIIYEARLNLFYVRGLRGSNLHPLTLNRSNQADLAPLFQCMRQIVFYGWA